MSKVIHNQRGAALVVTIAVVAILMVAALQLRKITVDALVDGVSRKDRFYAEQMALSGIHFASLVLAQDAEKTTIDSIQEEWADEEWMARAISQLGYADGALTVKITDESSKVQVNALLKNFPGNQVNEDQIKIWESFLRLTLSEEDENEPEGKDPAPVINCLKDWMDSLDDDTISGISGAESDYYLGLDPPYSCANGPLSHINELFLIKGITPDLLSYDGHLESIKQDETKKGLGEVITVFGLDDEYAQESGYRFTGKVNINTAPAIVLAALLPEGRAEYAQDLADFRSEKGEQGIEFINPLDKGWYKRVIDLSISEKERFDRTIGYASHFFMVECTAVEALASVNMVAFLKREKNATTGKWNCRILRMERKY